MKAHRGGDTLTDRPRPGDARRGPAAPAIALDAGFGNQSTGIGVYSRELLRGLRRGPYAERLLELAPERGQSRSLWLLGGVGGQLPGAALFHGLANFDLPWVKPRGVRLVLTVHDLIPLTWPASVSTAYRLQFRLWLSRSLALADAVIAVSAATAAELRLHFPRAAPATVIPLGSDHLARRRHRPADRRYVLALGTLEPRKNLSMLLKAFAAAARPGGPELWLVGGLAFGGRAVGDELQALAARGLPLRWLGAQSRPAVERLIAGAEALAAPSLAEGFGLPPLEALALGTPVLASDIPAHREVLGEAAWFLPAVDVASWTEALAAVAARGAWLERLRALGPPRAAAFSWRQTAEATAAVYRRVLEA